MNLYALASDVFSAEKYHSKMDEPWSRAHGPPVRYGDSEAADTDNTGLSGFLVQFIPSVLNAWPICPRCMALSDSSALELPK